MMLRSLVDEVVRRRLWPIPLLAVLVAVAAPVLFMKSAPEGAPAANAAPPPAAPGALPAPASKLLATTDSAVISHKRSKRKGQDPFAPPASAAQAEKKGAATATPAAVPVVVKNANGSTSTATIAPSTGKTTKVTRKTSAKKKKKVTTPKVTTPKVTTPKVTTPAAPVTYVDVRFGAHKDTMLRYRVPRLQTFQAGRRVAAMFVGYSETRNAATFAVAPSTQVKGMACRKVNGVCRYVDIPAGGYARLVLQAEDGSLISRRLDVVNIRHLTADSSGASARTTSLPAANCLLHGLLKLTPIAHSIPADACD
jgi:hypothetical protein